MPDARGSLHTRLAGFCFLGISAVPSPAMKKSLVFHICGVLCSILLLSPNAKGLSLQGLDKRNTLDGGFNGTVDTNADNILPPTPSSFENEKNNMSSHVTSDKVLAVTQESQNNLRLLSGSTVVVMSPETSNLGLIKGADPTAQAKSSGENEGLTTAPSTTDYASSVAPPVEANKDNTKKSSPQAEESNGKLKPSSLENSSQVNTIEMLTTNPRTSLVETKVDYSTISSPLTDQSLTTIRAEIPGALDPTVIVNKSNESAELITSEFGEDWDDTKVTTQSPTNLARVELATVVPDHLIEEEPVEEAMFTSSPVTTVMSDDKSVFNVTENSLVTNAGLKGSPDSLGPVVNDSIEFNPDLDLTMFTAKPNVEVNQSQDLAAANTDVNPLTTDMREDSAVTVTAAIYRNVTHQDTTREPEVMESSTVHKEIPQNESSEGSSTTAKTQESEGKALNPSSQDEEDEELLATSLSTVAPMATTEADSTTVITSTVTSVSHVSVDIPPTRRITTTASYGLDKLESEEGDDEDEEEEDDDEDDEEEEDDKDNDSVDESSERDSDIPLFTLPGLSSQEPLEDDGSVALIEGAAYPVPDSMEWEQQNQGLVRSWMEKLKDKAGYMSGMLVPVGVGIAGALFILGVLYSIKIMNRRRRNGFKRHKRKREFNSMQDRVMLLADSSEDEF
ncbi:armadillo-like helical domain-containing protein 4 isoform X2 [Bufo bufo]|uniref:armadillo-like helical domain-containing protein 4 isoform X2 n=1 Tax=Bufo bufo TaxID=8384 RepID=UPI001ABEAFCB|nr:armadillo-like helical domain-containing protein 4 isoform X2 [Bufo bufo]